MHNCRSFIKFLSHLIYFAVLVQGTYLIFIILIGVEAYTSSKKLKELTLQPYNKWYVYILIIIICRIILIPISGYVKDNTIKAYKISSRRMQPSLAKGDRLFADMKYY